MATPQRTAMPTKATPMLRFMRAMNKEEQEAFAAAVGTTRVYLYQLAAQEEPNPRLRLAVAICKESQRLSKRLMAEPLKVEDLLIGTSPDSR
jgi:DNA-binding XRE family transcriptional regulator